MSTSNKNTKTIVIVAAVALSLSAIIAVAYLSTSKKVVKKGTIKSKGTDKIMKEEEEVDEEEVKLKDENRVILDGNEDDTALKALYEDALRLAK